MAKKIAETQKKDKQKKKLLYKIKCFFFIDVSV